MIGMAAVLKIDFGRIQSRISGSQLGGWCSNQIAKSEFDKGDGNRGGESSWILGMF